MKIKASLSVAIILGVAAISSANIVTNGSFEAKSYGTGYKLISNDGIAGGWYAETDLLEIGAASVYGVTGQDGKQVLELDAKKNAKVSQKLTTIKSKYSVTFSAALRKNIASSSQGGDLYWNDVKVGSFLPTSTKMQDYKFFVTGTGSDKLSFIGAGKSDSYGTLIDNVSVQAVPEPTSMAALAVGGVAILRRRRKQA
jgi:hypothetical protein